MNGIVGRSFYGSHVTSFLLHDIDSNGHVRLVDFNGIGYMMDDDYYLRFSAN